MTSLAKSSLAKSSPEIAFIKMEGAGNDYLYIDGDAYAEDLKHTGLFLNASALHPHKIPWIAKLSHRHFGVGSDGVIFYQRMGKNHFSMRMYNSDGAESEMCGNGIRCLAYLFLKQGLVQDSAFSIQTLGGDKKIYWQKRGEDFKILVDMGVPNFSAQALPTTLNTENGRAQILDWKVGEVTYSLACVFLSMGNPHVILRVEELKSFPVEKLGPIIENDPRFPKRINCNFMSLNGNTICLRTWERGAGETLACGTGATATVVGALCNQWLAFPAKSAKETDLLGKEENLISLKVAGGILKVHWGGPNHPAYLTGPCKIVFSGTFSLPFFERKNP